MAPFKQKRIQAHKRYEHAGAPTLYRQEYCEQVENDMAKGYSLSAFAGLIRVGTETVYGWIERHAEFSEAVARGRAGRVRFLENHLLSSKKGAQTTAAIFALKNANPLEWRDIRTLQHEHNISVETLTLEQLEAIASGAHPGDHTILNATFTRVADTSADTKQIAQSNQCAPADNKSDDKNK